MFLFKDIPKFLQGRLYDELVSDNPDYYEEIDYLLPYLAFTEEINDFDSFKQLLKAEEYWDVKEYSISLYAYTLLDRENVFPFLQDIIIDNRNVYSKFYFNLISDFIFEHKADLLRYLREYYSNNPNFNSVYTELANSINIRIQFDYMDNLVVLVFLVDGVPTSSFLTSSTLSMVGEPEFFEPNLLIESIYNNQNFYRENVLYIDYGFHNIYYLADRKVIIFENTSNGIPNTSIEIKLTRYNIKNIFSDLDNIALLFAYFKYQANVYSEDNGDFDDFIYDPDGFRGKIDINTEPIFGDQGRLINVSFYNNPVSNPLTIQPFNHSII